MPETEDSFLKHSVKTKYFIKILTDHGFLQDFIVE